MGVYKMDNITYNDIYQIFENNYNDNMDNQIIKTDGVNINVEWDNKCITILFNKIDMMGEIELMDIARNIIMFSDNWIWHDLDVVEWEIVINNGFHGEKPHLYIGVTDFIYWGYGLRIINNNGGLKSPDKLKNGGYKMEKIIMNEIMNFVATLSNCLQNDDTGNFKLQLFDLMKSPDPIIWDETIENHNQIKQWLDIIENNVIYDNDGNFYGLDIGDL